MADDPRVLLQFGIRELDRLLGQPGMTPEDTDKTLAPESQDLNATGPAAASLEPDQAGVVAGSDQQITVPTDSIRIDSVKQDRYGLYVGINEATNTNASTSFAIVGPDGTGKSVLALHLASRYAAQCFHDKDDPPAVLYASTDLSYSKAISIWKNFGLRFPQHRDRELYDAVEVTYNEAIELKQYRPHSHTEQTPPILNYLLPPYGAPLPREVAFVDLEAHTAGDDWGFLTRMITSMSRPGSGQPLHLVIIDAVEGLQTMNGERDVYGEERTRRSRIAQLIRAANGKCHLIFIVEEPKSDERFPEQFVADAVIRLRYMTSKHGYNHRTLEVEKVRAQTHVRGQHVYAIRSGQGSSTGKQDNADERKHILRKEVTGETEDSLLSYVIVFPSLDFSYRVEMQRHAESADDFRQQPVQNLGFGIPYLDSMLAAKTENTICGIPARSVTGIIGPSKTHKSRLGRAFLSQCFAQTPIGANSGVAVLITTEDIHSHSLAHKFYEWHYNRSSQTTTQNPSGFLNAVQNRIVCRRLEVHSLTPAVLFHIIKESVDAAKSILLPDWKPKENKYTSDEFRQFAQIRIVIDNWTTIASTYPAVKDDPLFLPYLFFYLKRQGVTTLILESQSVGDVPAFSQAYESSLTNLVDHTLLTWNVRFQGRRMTAISPLTAFSPGQRSVVREAARTEESLNQDLDTVHVDPHLELYQNLIAGEPSPVPLHVRLFTEGPWAAEYAESVNVLLRDLFPPMEKYNNNIVSATPHPFEEHGEKRYERLRQICGLHTGSLDHTVVWQVDEFWGIHGRDGKMNLSDYLNSSTDTGDLEQDKIADPYSLFRWHEGVDRNTEGTQRIRFFDLAKLHYSNSGPANIDDAQREVQRRAGAAPYFDRVPYTWDFGFLMCRSEAWKRAAERKLPTTTRKNAVLLRVKDVWNALIRKEGAAENCPDGGKLQRAGSWRYFLEACQVVALSNKSSISPLPAAFDLSVLTPESVSCLVLEIWMSEIYRRLLKGGSAIADDTKSEGVSGGLAEAADLMKSVGGERSLATAPQNKYSLADLIEKYPLDLYKTLILLFEVIDCKSLINRGKVTSYNIRDAASNAIAVRHWYKTASGTAQNYEPSDPLVPVRLPGNFSVRGDWFLAMASGSRSMRLGERAIDLMTSRRSNIYRLQLGVGLPTRQLMDAKGYKGLQTCLFTNRETVTAYYKHDENTELPFEAPSPFHDNIKNEWYPGSRRQPLSYQDLLDLGASPHMDPANAATDQAFSWLWRSHLKHYDRQARIWHQWLCRLFIDLEDLRRSRGPDWRSGFREYDDVASGSDPTRYYSHEVFEDSRSLLLVELGAATPHEIDQTTSVSVVGPSPS